MKDNAITYTKMGMAALLPGMQFMLDKMQKELDAMRMQLAGVRDRPTRQSRGAAEPAARYGWSDDPAERKREMKRRMAVHRAKVARASKAAKRKTPTVRMAIEERKTNGRAVA